LPSNNLISTKTAAALGARAHANHQGFHGERFFVLQNGVRWATPMFLVLVLIEASDLMFAVDSIPAIFAVTTDPFIVFTSNIFAIMGLRALYFLLADMADRFHLLKYGLAIVLVFIGGKMTLMPWFHMPVEWSLAVVGGVILGSVVLSLIVTRKKTNPCGCEQAAICFQRRSKIAPAAAPTGGGGYLST
jgi:TerC family integral membrane protein